eukprot:CAMPEP_0182539918 /NCGR_PEP_ID=MMETSP1323-20130603/26203_1 /TAXON_ID=236787 /ORGANISM="Florenciella parvula, Strain RCC1693" /LENGTH=70 /DNA_ID=CAMNT_0024750527 /DNA_START=1 /DNA_END=213 /DNA_ORIENTATION=+
MGQGGPQEIVSRHPTTWGWIMFSQGTVWTTWPNPYPGSPEEDPLLKEENLESLPSILRPPPPSRTYTEVP